MYFHTLTKNTKKLADSTSANLRFYPYKFTLVSRELLELLYVLAGAICRTLKILKFMHIEEICSSYPQNSVYFVFGIPSALGRKNFYDIFVKVWKKIMFVLCLDLEILPQY